MKLRPALHDGVHVVNFLWSGVSTFNLQVSGMECKLDTGKT